MTSLVRGPLHGEIIAPGRGLSLIVVPRVLSLDALPPIEVEAGLSLVEIETRVRAMSGAGPLVRYIALINDHPISDALWGAVRPKPGTVVLFRAVADFGGDNTVLKTVLSAAVLVAGAVLTTINPILGAVATVGGQLLVNALFPIAPPVMASVDAGSLSSPSYSLAGSSNAAELYGVVPHHLGRNRYTPHSGSKTYTEFVGADQYLRMLVVWGEGPLEISDLKLGETPIGSFQDVEIETRLGYPDDAPISLYPNDVEEETLAIELSVAAGPQVRRTSLSTDEISVDAVAPGGMGGFDANGAAYSYTVVIRYDYSLVGSGVWTPLGTLTFSGRSRDVIRKGLRLAVPNGQYDVQPTKISADYAGADTVVEQVVWSALRSFHNAAPISYAKPLAMTAIRIRASAQLTGVVDDLNAVVASVVTAFDGATWHDNVVSNNPADLFRHVCQGPGLAKPLTDDQVDIESLEAWWVYCAAKGFTFNMVRDFKASADEALIAIASAGRATLKRRDGKRGVVWDDPDALVKQFFTPRNSWGFSWERQYRKSPPHGFRIRFINEEAGYAQDEMIVYDDGYNADGSGGKTKASLFEGIETPGRTKPDLIWKDGRYHIAQQRLRPDKYVLNADLRSFASARGDRVRVMSDVALWGMAAGRVISGAAAGANDQVVLDEPVIMEAGKTYTIRFWLNDGTTGTRVVVTDDGEQQTLTLVGHDLLPASDDEWSFGEEGKDSVVLRVQRVVAGPNLSAKLYLVDDAPEIALAEQGAIPPFNSQITVPVDRFTAAPVNLTVQEAFEGVEGAATTGVLFSWETLAGETVAGFEAQFRDDDGDGVWRDAPGNPISASLRATFLTGIVRGAWSFRVRCIFENGKPSRWAELALTTITAGGELILPNVENFVTSYDNNRASLKWDKVKFSKLEVFYEIRKGADWETGLTLFPQVADSPVALPGNGTFLIKAKAQPLPGITIYSADAALLTVTGAILVRNVLSILDERANGWTGTITGPAIVDGAFIRTTAAGEWAFYEIAADRIFDNGFLREIRIESSLDAVGVAADDNFLTNPDVINTADLYSSALTQLIETKVEIAEALDINEDVYAGQDVYASPDVYAGSVVFLDWRAFVPDQYFNRFSKLRFGMRSNDPNVHGALLDWVVKGDVPDRLDHYTNLVAPSGGVTVTFTPKGGADPRPFKGGPDGAPGSAPHYQIAILNGAAGDHHEVTTPISLSGMAFRVLNSLGVPVDRVVNLEVQGY